MICMCGARGSVLRRILVQTPPRLMIGFGFLIQSECVTAFLLLEVTLACPVLTDHKLGGYSGASRVISVPDFQYLLKSILINPRIRVNSSSNQPSTNRMTLGCTFLKLPPIY